MPRPQTTEFANLRFTLVKINGRHGAFCEVCLKTLKNTASARLIVHRFVFDLFINIFTLNIISLICHSLNIFQK